MNKDKIIEIPLVFSIHGPVDATEEEYEGIEERVREHLRWLVKDQLTELAFCLKRTNQNDKTWFHVEQLKGVE